MVCGRSVKLEMAFSEHVRSFEFLITSSRHPVRYTYGNDNSCLMQTASALVDDKNTLFQTNFSYVHADNIYIQLHLTNLISFPKAQLHYTQKQLDTHWVKCTRCKWLI